MKPSSMMRTGLICLFACSSFAAANVMAQVTKVPDHPRINEVNRRIDNQQTHTQKGTAQGTVTARQSANDQKRDANIAQRMSSDEAKHNGHLTRREHQHLNRAENRNARRIHRQRKH